MIQASLLSLVVVAFNLFGLALLTTSGHRDETAKHENIQLLEHPYRGPTTIHGEQLMGNFLQLLAKSAHPDKETNNWLFLKKTATPGELMVGRKARSRRGMGYRMRCLPTAKKVCRSIRYKGKERSFCKFVVHEKCYAVD